MADKIQNLHKEREMTASAKKIASVFLTTVSFSVKADIYECKKLGTYRVEGLTSKGLKV